MNEPGGVSRLPVAEISEVAVFGGAARKRRRAKGRQGGNSRAAGHSNSKRTTLRDSLAVLLDMAGHETQAVHSGREALARAESFQPDVIQLDIGLPEMDGYEVARRIRELPGGRAVRLVAVTGYGGPEDRLRTRAAGFDAHLLKPLELETLAGALVDGGTKPS